MTRQLKTVPTIHPTTILHIHTHTDSGSVHHRITLLTLSSYQSYNQRIPKDDAHSACLSGFLCLVLDEWPTSTTKFPSGAQKIPFYWKPSFDAQRTRMGDVCEVGKRIQSVWIETLILHLSNALSRFRYYSCQRIRDINDYLKFLQSRHRPSRPKIQYLLQQVSSRFKYLFWSQIHRNSSLLQLDHTSPCSTNC